MPFEDLSGSFVTTQTARGARLQYDTALAFLAWLRTGERGSQFRLAMQRLFEDWTLAKSFEDAYGASLPDLYARFQRELRR